MPLSSAQNEVSAAEPGTLIPAAPRADSSCALPISPVASFFSCSSVSDLTISISFTAASSSLLRYFISFTAMLSAFILITGRVPANRFISALLPSTSLRSALYSSTGFSGLHICIVFRVFTSLSSSISAWGAESVRELPT